jgi:mannosyltransferase
MRAVREDQGCALHHKKTIGLYALLSGIVIAGAWLRLRNLTTESLWFDEAASWMQSSGTLAELISRTAEDNYPPLHNLLLFAFMNVTGSDAEWVLRLPSALLGIASLGAVYWLGTLVGGRLAGIFAAAILAVSTTHIFYSQEARMYSLLALAATLYAASSFYFITSPTTSRAALLAVSGLALVYSHPFGMLNWIAIAIGIGAHILFTAGVSRRGLVQWTAANVAIAVGFLPWAIVLLGRSQAIAGSFWIPDPTPAYVDRQLQLLLGGHAAGAALLAGAVTGYRPNPRAFGILLLWLIGPMLAALVLSVLHTPIFFYRYLIGGLPALAMLAGLGMARLARWPWWWTRLAAVALLGIATVENVRFVPWQRTNWRAVAAYLDERLQDGDCVLVYPGHQMPPLRYYLRRPFCTVLPEPVEAVDLEATGASRIFAVFAQPEFGPVRDKLRAFGRRGESLSVPRISVVEYQRKR